MGEKGKKGKSKSKDKGKGEGKGEGKGKDGKGYADGQGYTEADNKGKDQHEKLWLYEGRWRTRDELDLPLMLSPSEMRDWDGNTPHGHGCGRRLFKTHQWPSEPAW